jgi:S-DNA-T family DNA segregation ATPase FtsK/SpoIIIE
MAQPATDVTGPTAAGPGLRRLASPAVRAAILRRANELGGTLLGFAGLALLLAVGSHDPADPSLSTATSRAPTNLAGPLGATLSDVLWQGFGWAAFLPALVLVAWAIRMATQRGVSLLPARIAALLMAMPLLAGLFEMLPDAVSHGASGAAGPLVSAAILTTLESLFGPLGRLTAQLAMGGITGAMLYVAFGLSLGEWRRAARVTADAGLGAARVGARRRHWVTRPLGWLGRGLWAAVPKRRRVEPAADLATVLRAADAAAEAATPRLRPAMPEPEARPAPRATPRVAMPAKAKPNASQAALDLSMSGWRTPPLDLLAPPPARIAAGPSAEALQGNARMLEQVLNDYGVSGAISEIRPGPVVTLYELEPAPGTKSSRVIGLADDIARSMSVVAVRIATVPGRNVIGIEMPNVKRETVFLREMLAADDYARTSARLPLVLGKDIGGAPVIADLARMPHLLIAGTTGSGKSVGINTFILSLLFRFSPSECRFIMIDPKMLELSVYDRIPHLLAPVVTEPPKAIGA